MVGRALSLAALALCFLLPSAAWARTDNRTTGMSRLHVDGAPKLLRHQIDAVCAAEDELSCEVTVRWTLPPSDTERNAALYFQSGTVQRLAVDGQSSPYIIDGGDPEAAWTTDGLSRLRTVLPPGHEPLVLELRATLALVSGGPYCAFGMTWPLAEQRHYTQVPLAIDLQFETILSDGEHDPPPVTFDGEVEYHVETPRAWHIASWESERRGRRRVSTRRQADLHVRGMDRLLIHGPVMGAGLRFHGKDLRPWLRGGWEVSRVDFMLHTLTVESDLRRVSVVPATEVGTGGWLFIPALSAGLGVPLRVTPEVRPGVRVFGGLNFPIASLVGGYDVFPAIRGNATEHIGHLGVQFSL